MREKTGELIDLIWDGKPDGYYIRGHVGIDEAKNAMRAYDGEKEYPAAKITHIWFKWVRAGEEDGALEGCTLMLRTSKTERKRWSRATRFDYGEAE